MALNQEKYLSNQNHMIMNKVGESMLDKREILLKYNDLNSDINDIWRSL